jgi:hypothetical protein
MPNIPLREEIPYDPLCPEIIIIYKKDFEVVTVVIEMLNVVKLKLKIKYFAIFFLRFTY